VSLAARYRTGPAELPTAGCRLPAGAEDHIAVFDDLGRELVSAIAPPFVSAGVLKRYDSVANRRPGLDLTVHWSLRRWPGERGSGAWAQIFRDGVEQDGEVVPDDRPADIAIACDYRDFARFLVGAGTITQARGQVRVEKGGVTEMSCLNGLVLDETALRIVGVPAELRHLLAEGIAQL
jgi:hypothetical protein